MALVTCWRAFQLRRLAQSVVPGLAARHFSCKFMYKKALVARRNSFDDLLWVQFWQWSTFGARQRLARWDQDSMSPTSVHGTDRSGENTTGVQTTRWVLEPKWPICIIQVNTIYIIIYMYIFSRLHIYIYYIQYTYQIHSNECSAAGWSGRSSRATPPTAGDPNLKFCRLKTSINV